MSIKETLFTSKEHYLAFRKQWAKACNAPEAKSTTEPCDEYLTNPINFTWRRSKGTGTRKVHGWLTGAHHLLYNIARDKPHHAGFTPITSKIRLLNGAIIDHGLYEATNWLRMKIGYAQRVIEFPTLMSDTRNDKWKLRSHENNKKRVADFLKPFNGTFTLEMLASIEVPRRKCIWASWGKGTVIAKQILTNPTITHKEVWEMINDNS